MNHFVTHLSLDNWRSGVYAIPNLFKQMMIKGAEHSLLKAKVFGGAAVLTTPNHFNVNEKNIVLTKQLLRQYKVPIVTQSLGGNVGMKIFFNTETYEVLLKRNKEGAVWDTNKV